MVKLLLEVTHTLDLLLDTKDILANLSITSNRF